MFTTKYYVYFPSPGGAPAADNIHLWMLSQHLKLWYLIHGKDPCITQSHPKGTPPWELLH